MIGLFKRKIKVGSLVEILNLDAYQLSEVLFHRGCVNKEIMGKSVIGMKFYVEYVSPKGDVYLRGWHFHNYKPEYEGLKSPGFHKTQLKLL